MLDQQLHVPFFILFRDAYALAPWHQLNHILLSLLPILPRMHCHKKQLITENFLHPSYASSFQQRQDPVPDEVLPQILKSQCPSTVSMERHYRGYF